MLNETFFVIFKYPIVDLAKKPYFLNTLKKHSDDATDATSFNLPITTVKIDLFKVKEMKYNVQM